MIIMDVPCRYVMGETECRAARLPVRVAPFRLGRTMDNIQSRRGDFVSGRLENRARLEEMIK